MHLAQASTVSAWLSSSYVAASLRIFSWWNYIQSVGRASNTTRTLNFAVKHGRKHRRKVDMTWIWMKPNKRTKTFSIRMSNVHVETKGPLQKQRTSTLCLSGFYWINYNNQTKYFHVKNGDNCSQLKAVMLCSALLTENACLQRGYWNQMHKTVASSSLSCQLFLQRRGTFHRLRRHSHQSFGDTQTERERERSWQAANGDRVINGSSFFMPTSPVY